MMQITVDADQIYVPGAFKCAKCGFVLRKVTLFMGDGTSCADSKPGDKCPNDGAPMWRQSYKDAYEEMCEIAAHDCEMRATIDRLRDGEGHSVEILCDNNDINGQPDRAIEVTAEWTNYEPRRYADDVLLECFRKADADRMAWRGE